TTTHRSRSSATEVDQLQTSEVVATIAPVLPPLLTIPQQRQSATPPRRSLAHSNPSHRSRPSLANQLLALGSYTSTTTSRWVRTGLVASRSNSLARNSTAAE